MEVEAAPAKIGDLVMRLATMGQSGERNHGSTVVEETFCLNSTKNEKPHRICYLCAARRHLSPVKANALDSLQYAGCLLRFLFLRMTVEDLTPAKHFLYI
jgi:hypothetical protein